jgi:hypothetical protein
MNFKSSKDSLPVYYYDFIPHYGDIGVLLFLYVYFQTISLGCLSSPYLSNIINIDHNSIYPTQFMFLRVFSDLPESCSKTKQTKHPRVSVHLNRKCIIRILKYKNFIIGLIKPILITLTRFTGVSHSMRIFLVCNTSREPE